MWSCRPCLGYWWEHFEGRVLLIRQCHRRFGSSLSYLLLRCSLIFSGSFVSSRRMGVCRFYFPGDSCGFCLNPLHWSKLWFHRMSQMGASPDYLKHSPIWNTLSFKHFIFMYYWNLHIVLITGCLVIILQSKSLLTETQDDQGALDLWASPPRERLKLLCRKWTDGYVVNDFWDVNNVLSSEQSILLCISTAIVGSVVSRKERFL